MNDVSLADESETRRPAGRAAPMNGEAACSTTAATENDPSPTAVVYGCYALSVAALANVLARAGVTVTASTSDSEAAVALVAARRPDLFLAAAEGSAHGSVLESVRRAHAASPSTTAIVLAPDRDADDIAAAFAAGVTVYCLDTARVEDLVTAIRQALERSVYYAPPPGMRRAEDTAPASETPDAKLTRREREILQLVAEGSSNAELARILGVAEQTVKFHLSNVYRKIGVSNRTEASRWAQVHGLLPRRPPPPSPG